MKKPAGGKSLERNYKMGMLVCTCNPATWEMEVGGDCGSRPVWAKKQDLSEKQDKHGDAFL
jgi:hypothetical protein